MAWIFYYGNVPESLMARIHFILPTDTSSVLVSYCTCLYFKSTKRNCSGRHFDFCLFFRDTCNKALRFISIVCQSKCQVLFFSENKQTIKKKKKKKRRKIRMSSASILFSAFKVKQAIEICSFLLYYKKEPSKMLLTCMSLIIFIYFFFFFFFAAGSEFGISE